MDGRPWAVASWGSPVCLRTSADCARCPVLSLPEQAHGQLQQMAGGRRGQCLTRPAQGLGDMTAGGGPLTVSRPRAAAGPVRTHRDDGCGSRRRPPSLIRLSPGPDRSGGRCLGGDQTGSGPPGLTSRCCRDPVPQTFPLFPRHSSN